jgi:integrase
VAVQREITAPMGLWKWAIRRGYTEGNPWTDQTAGMRRGANDGGGEDDTKRAFTAPQLLTRIHAGERDWAPNGGGFAATLWDAVRLALLTGLRAAELADLRIRDLHNDRTVISVPKGKTKNARRMVPMPVLAQRVVEARIAVLPDQSPDAPLWPELAITRLTGSRGGKLSDKFRKSRPRLLPTAENVDLHSLRRSCATMLEAAMNAGGRINPVIIARLMGQSGGTLALDRYSSGASLQALKDAVADLEALGLGADIQKALADTASQRPPMVRFKPAGAEPMVTPERQPKRRRGRPRSPSPSLAHSRAVS